MFKLSIVDMPAQHRLVIEGKVTDLRVAELRTTYRSAMRDLEGRKLTINLSRR